MTEFSRTLKPITGVALALACAVSLTACGGADEAAAVGDASVEDRIAPVGKVNVAAASAPPAAPAPAAAAPAPAAPAAPAPAAAEAAPAASVGPDGAAIVAQACAACHATGVLEAPKIGDKAGWEARGDLDALTASAIAGKGAMPPRGGGQFSDEEIRAAVAHMLKESGIGGGAVAAVKAAVTDAADKAGAAASAVASSVSGAVAGAVDAVSGAIGALGGADLAKGKEVYDNACFVCHTTGAAGAPKLGDQAAWAPRIAKGGDALKQSALKGLNGMPPKGGRPDLGDEDVTAAAAYMVDQSK